MLRADSPSSLYSRDVDSTTPKAYNTPVNQQKAVYSLFPTVEPTPPTSPIAFQKATRSKAQAAEAVRRRSSSWDNAARTSSAVLRHGAHRPATVVSRNGRKGSASCDIKPMSTVQELPLDSPTVPARFTLKFGVNRASDDSGHGRSISAPSEYPRDNVTQSPLAHSVANAVYQSEQAMTSAQTVHGLGLTVDEDSANEVSLSWTTPKYGPLLRLETTRDKALPPPPPPKSPRYHSRNTSAAHSRTSSAQSHMSIREDTPVVTAQTVSCSAVKPTFVTHTPPRSMSPAGAQRPHPRKVPSSQGLREWDSRVRGILNGFNDGRGRPMERKPLPTAPATIASNEPSGLPLEPSSKSRAESSTVDASPDGEKTPKAVTSVVVIEAQARAQTKRQTLPVSNATVRTSSEGSKAHETVEDQPPPTPMKDDLHVRAIVTSLQSRHQRH